MILGVHSNASYLSEPKARSRVGGHFFLSDGTDEAPPNSAILNTSHIIKSVMSSAAEAELGALYLHQRPQGVPCRTFLNELGHPQPPTPIQTDNSTALGVVTNNILPRRTKAMDMRYTGGYATVTTRSSSVITGALGPQIAATISRSITVPPITKKSGTST
jgi:hypothetical protein